MAGPNSLPIGSRVEYDRLNSERCDVHAEGKCDLDRDNCRAIRWRDWYLKRNRLVTGKTSKKHGS